MILLNGHPRMFYRGPSAIELEGRGFPIKHSGMTNLLLCTGDVNLIAVL